MTSLHGFSYSDYYNIVEHVLLHKGLGFEEDLQFGNAEAFHAISPLGKAPAARCVDAGRDANGSVFFAYLKERYGI